MDARSELVKKGYEPPIHNFNIVSPDGNDITQHILSEPGFSFLLISYDAAKADTGAFKQANDLFHLSQTLPGIDFYAVTASNDDVLKELRQKTGIDYDFCLADEITLKTIVRSNPGLLLLRDGTILAKWGSRDFPGRKELKAYSGVFEYYPLCDGCDPQMISRPPFGSVADKLETILEYRNVRTDSVASFSINNFPRNKEEWVFENSVTKIIPGSYRSPFDNFKIMSVYGMDYTDIILNNPGVSFLVFLRSPFETNQMYLQKINILAGMAGDHLNVPYEFYGITALKDDDILRFTDGFISPVEFFHVPDEVMNLTDFRDVLLLMLRNGKIEKVWKDEIPDPAALDNLKYEELKPADEVFMPFILTNFRNVMEKRLVYHVHCLPSLPLFS